MRAPSPFRSAHWMLLALAFALGLGFWAVKAAFHQRFGNEFGKQVEDFYENPTLLAALKSFEPAIVLAVPGKTYPDPAQDALRAKFPSAGAEALRQLAEDLQAISDKLRAKSPAGRPLRFDLNQWPAPAAGRGAVAALEAAHWLAQGQRLDKLDWPGLRQAGSAQLMNVPDGVFRQDNPWHGLAGCVYLRGAGGGWLYLEERRDSGDYCPAMLPPGPNGQPALPVSRAAPPKGKDDPAWALPEDLGYILSGVGRLRSPAGAAYAEYTRPRQDGPPDNRPDADTIPRHGPNTKTLHGREREVGFNAVLTLNPATQSLAQRWAVCYTGGQAVCEGLGLAAKDPLRKLAAEMYENAAVRMVAVAVLDVAGGRIEALGSADTDCYRQDHSGLSHAGDCPDAPFVPHVDPDRLRNHALFLDAMPASTVKPVMALAFLNDNPAYRGQGYKKLAEDLKTSNSEEFLNRLFCGDGKPPWQTDTCARPKLAQDAAAALGWNLGCGADGSADCGRLDVLFGRPSARWPVTGVDPVGLDFLYGRLFTEPPERAKPGPAPDEWAREDGQEAETGFRLIQQFRFHEDFVKKCSQKDWEKCQGADGKLVSEGWGQGNARATPLAVAGMLSRLAAAANGAQAQAFPHLLEAMTDAGGKPLALAVQRAARPEPLAVDPALAKLILQGMASHQSLATGGAKNGTAHEACKNVFGAKACDAIDWIAGKTGTPPFGFDNAVLADIKKACHAKDGQPKTGCNLLPYKWYVAAFKTGVGPDAPYDKAVAVLTERNWRRTNQKVQAPKDSEVNLSAELALRIIQALRPPPPSGKPKP